MDIAVAIVKTKRATSRMVSRNCEVEVITIYILEL